MLYGFDSAVSFEEFVKMIQMPGANSWSQMVGQQRQQGEVASVAVLRHSLGKGARLAGVNQATVWTVTVTRWKLVFFVSPASTRTILEAKSVQSVLMATSQS